MADKKPIVNYSGKTDELHSLDAIYALAQNIPVYIGTVTLPTLTKNVDGTVTIGNDGVCIFNTLPNGTGSNVKLNCSTGATLTMTDASVNYIYANYNSGSPIYAVLLTPATFLTRADYVPIVRVTREGTTLHFEEYDQYGIQLSAKSLYKDVTLHSFERQSGLVLSTAATRISTVTAGVAWFGVQYYSMAENKSGTSGTMYEYYPTAGVYSRSLVTAYDSSYYSDGTNRSSLGSNKYVAKYFFRDVGDDNEVYYIHGNEYVKESDAINEVLPTTPMIITAHSIYVGKIVIQQGATNGVAYPRVWEGTISSAGVTNHNDLSNIQGGTANNYYHSNQAINSTDSPTFANITDTGLTASRAVVSDASKVLTSSATTATELGYVNGVTSAIQTQLDGKEPFHGFVDSSLSSVSVSGLTVTLTKISNYTVYVNGALITVTANKTATISDTTGLHYIAMLPDGSLTVLAGAWDIRSYAAIPVAIVWRIAGTSSRVWDERHSSKRNVEWHYATHRNIGSRYVSGLTGTFTTSTISVGSGEIMDEDISNTTGGTVTTVTHVYRATGGVNQLYDNTPATSVIKTDGTNPVYDLNGVLTPLDNNTYGNYFVYMTNDATNKTINTSNTQLYCVIGQGQYTSVANAQAAPNPSFNSGFTTAEIKLLYRVIIRRTAGAPAGTYIQADDLRAVSTGPAISGSTGTVTAATVTFSPAGNIAATNVQTAIEELDTEKAPITSPTFATSITGSYLTASEVLVTDSSKNIVSAPVVTYPSLTELSYVKGVTSALQTQIDGKINTNYIINGNFDFWQRGTSTSSTGYLADRFASYVVGSSVTDSRQSFTIGQTDVPNNPKYYSRHVVTSVAGANNCVLFYSRLEDVTKLAGKTITLSFYAKADANKNIAVNFDQYFGTGGSPSAQVYTGATTCALTTSWQKFTVTATFASVSGKTLGTTGNDGSTIEFWFDAGSNLNSYTNSLGQQSGTFDIAQIKLEEGSIATPFVLAGGTLAGELVACQRYYEKSYSLNDIPGTSTATDAVIFTGYGTTELYGNVAYKASKRVAPVVTIYNFQGTTGDVTKLSDALALGSTGMALSWAGVNGFTRLSKTGGTNVTAGAQYFFHWTANAEL